VYVAVFKATRSAKFSPLRRLLRSDYISFVLQKIVHTNVRLLTCRVTTFLAPVLSLFEDKSSIFFFRLLRWVFGQWHRILFLECAPAFPVTFSIQPIPPSKRNFLETQPRVSSYSALSGFVSSIFRNWLKQLIIHWYLKVNYIWNSIVCPNSSTISLSNSLLFWYYFFTGKHFGVVWNRIKFRSRTSSFQCIRHWNLAFISLKRQENQKRTLIHTDLGIPFVADEIHKSSLRYHQRLASHHNVLVAALSTPPTVTRRLKRQWPSDLHYKDSD